MSMERRDLAAVRVGTRFGKTLGAGIVLAVAFALWTLLVQTVDVRAVGPQGTSVGFATINVWVHDLFGVHMAIYTVTDWLGLVPILVCLGFGCLGAAQLASRRSLLRVDADLILLGLHYVVVICAYLLFEMVPLNYRPVLIDGVLEASYPSSTTLLVLSVMPTLALEVDRRSTSPLTRALVRTFAIVFSAGMVAGRLVAGVHWMTDIVGSILLGAALVTLWRAACELSEKRPRDTRVKE